MRECLLVGPVYAGKAIALDGRFAPEAAGAFIHTGGTPALFAYQDAVLANTAEYACLRRLARSTTCRLQIPPEQEKFWTILDRCC
jgi:hypothetical protein